MNPICSSIFCISIILLGCRSNNKPNTYTKDSMNIYPKLGYVCFTQANIQSRSGEIFYLGDSLQKIARLIQLNPKNDLPMLQMGNSFSEKGQSGICAIDYVATFDNAKRLINFKAIWTYKG